jgi:hypothetical protein
MVRHKRIRLLFAPSQLLQVAQRLLELIEVAGDSLQFFLRRLLLFRGLGQALLPPRQGSALLFQIPRFRVHGLLEMLELLLLFLDFLVRRGGLPQDGLQLGLQLLLLPGQRIVKLLALAFPFGFVEGCQLGPASGSFHGRLLHLRPRRDLRPAIDHQQQQDQRPHGA